MKNKLKFHTRKKRVKEDSTDDLVEEIIENLQDTEDPLEEIRQKVKLHRYQFWKKIMIGIVVILLLAVCFGLILKYQTYTDIDTIEVYPNKDADANNYTEYAGGILKYSRDGIVFLNEKGEEIWNQPCQMKNPEVHVRKGTAAVGDRGGTSILIFQKDGLKGEIHTTSPIQKLTISEQGIVGVILKNEDTPKILCYDAKGNILVEQKASLTNTGYPLDVAISNDGKTLLVSYVYIKGNKTASKAIYYNFGKTGADKQNHEIIETEYVDTIIPDVEFLDAKTSVLIGENLLVFNRGTDNPKEIKKAEIKKEIKSIAYDKSGVTLLLKQAGETGYELCTYNTNGDKIISEDMQAEYRNIKMSDRHIFLFEENKCSIYTLDGIHKFEGKTNTKIKDIFSKGGLNKYMMISTDGLKEIQLVK